MATPNKFEFHAAAILEIREAIFWYQARNPDAAHQFRNEVKRAEKMVSTRPHVWPDYLHGTKRYVLHKFPFSLIYMSHEDSLVGLAVAHSRRRPGYWKDRM